MKYVTSIILALMLAVSAFAQQTNNTVTLDVNQLPESIKQQIVQQAALQETKAKVAQYGEWVGLGKELGTAVDEGLTAVTKHADNIAETKVGMLTMFLITYKVIGTDLVQLVVGLMFSFVWVPYFLFAFYRNVIKRRVLKRESFGADGKIVNREFETENDDDDGGRQISYYLCFLALVGITSAIIFAG
jgi:hypothetical protein